MSLVDFIRSPLIPIIFGPLSVVSIVVFIRWGKKSSNPSSVSQLTDSSWSSRSGLADDQWTQAEMRDFLSFLNSLVCCLQVDNPWRTKQPIALVGQSILDIIRQLSPTYSRWETFKYKSAALLPEDFDRLVRIYLEDNEAWATILDDCHPAIAANQPLLSLTRVLWGALQRD